MSLIVTPIEHRAREFSSSQKNNENDVQTRISDTFIPNTQVLITPLVVEENRMVESSNPIEEKEDKEKAQHLLLDRGTQQNLNSFYTIRRLPVFHDRLNISIPVCERKQITGNQGAKINFLKRIPFSYRCIIHPPVRQPNRSNWQDFLLDQKLMDCLPKHAIDQISERWAHTLLYNTCKDLPGFQCYSHDKALEILQKGFSRGTSIDPFMKNAIAALSSQLSERDQQVFSYRVFIPKDSNSPEGLLYLFFAKKYFMPVIEHTENNYEILILPPLLFKRLLKNRFPSTAMTPVPILAYRKKITLTDPERRIMSISSPLAPPLEVHGCKCALHPTMYYHDMYHLLIESANPHREAWIQFFQILSNAPTDLCTKSYLEEMKEACLDREFISYYTNSLVSNPVSNSKVFWYQVAMLDKLSDWTKKSDLGKYALNRLKEVAKNEQWEDRFGIYVQDVENQNVSQILES